MAAHGYDKIPEQPSAMFDVADYHDPARAQWARDSDARSAGSYVGGGAAGEPSNGRPQGGAGRGGPSAGYGPGGAPARGSAGPYPPPGGSLRRPSPSLGLPPTVQAAAPQQAPPRTFARALGMPGANAPIPRPKNVRPFDPNDLERIPREAVEVWKALKRGFPGFFRSPELNQAVFDFLSGVFGGDEAGGARTLTLEVRRKDDGGTAEHQLVGPEVTIGSHAQNSLQIISAQVSRRHARIVHDEAGWRLVDQNSSNGTFLRGERVQPGYGYPLRNGETISIPGHDITVKWTDAASGPKLVAVRVSGVRIEPIARVFEAAPAQGFVAAVRLEPAGLRAFIEVDLPLAALAISRVLGPAGAGQAAAALAASSSGSSAGVPIRPLSEVEKGVLELLFVKLLDSIGRRWGERAELTFHLERLFDAKDPALGDQTGLGQAVVATATIDFEARRESARVILPDAAMAALAPRLETLVPRAGDAMSEVIGRLRDVIGLAQIEVRGTAGRSKLTRAELATLSVGDIIVPDELHLRAGEAGLAGSVDFVIGAGRGETRMRGELTGWDGTMYQVRLTEFLKGSGRREARVSAMDYGEEGGSAVQGESAEAEGAALLEDVPIPLVIELGRLNMTVREIAELRQGEVLELGRSPTEPVALVVEGRVIGGGKLVNVEGEIGVQITSLSR